MPIKESVGVLVLKNELKYIMNDGRRHNRKIKTTWYNLFLLLKETHKDIVQILKINISRFIQVYILFDEIHFTESFETVMQACETTNEKNYLTI
jgi:hypothetical protein